MKKVQVVCVEWYDHTTWSSNGWIDIKTIKKYGLSLIKTVGFLMSKDKKIVRVALNHGDDNTFADFICIDRGSIKKIKKITTIEV